MSFDFKRKIKVFAFLAYFMYNKIDKKIEVPFSFRNEILYSSFFQS